MANEHFVELLRNSDKGVRVTNTRLRKFTWVVCPSMSEHVKLVLTLWNDFFRMSISVLCGASSASEANSIEQVSGHVKRSRFQNPRAGE